MTTYRILWRNINYKPKFSIKNYYWKKKITPIFKFRHCIKWKFFFIFLGFLWLFQL